jgi:hypothetical protein
MSLTQSATQRLALVACSWVLNSLIGFRTSNCISIGHLLLPLPVSVPARPLPHSDRAADNVNNDNEIITRFQSEDLVCILTTLRAADNVRTLKSDVSVSRCGVILIVRMGLQVIWNPKKEVSSPFRYPSPFVRCLEGSRGPLGFVILVCGVIGKRESTLVRIPSSGNGHYA